MTITIYCFRVYCCPHLHLGLFLVSLLKNHQLENFRLAIVDLSSICFDFGLFSKNFLAPSVTFKFSRTKVITHALYWSKGATLILRYSTKFQSSVRGYTVAKASSNRINLGLTYQDDLFQ